MPSLETILLMTIAAVIMNALPGPSQLYVVTRTIALGRAAGFASASGLASGAVVHVVLAATGLTALMAATPVLFDVVRWIGAAYLIWLGIATWREKDASDSPDAKTPVTRRSARHLFRQGFIIEVLNPKTALFFLAFLPQFVSPASPTPGLEMLILGLLVPLTALPVDLAIAFGASAALSRLGQNPAMARLRRWLAGSVLVGLGLFVLVEDGR
ncbi:MAG: LysE family translocator [Alphaproteobacteria bacterium]